LRNVISEALCGAVHSPSYSSTTQAVGVTALFRSEVSVLATGTPHNEIARGVAGNLVIEVHVSSNSLYSGIVRVQSIEGGITVGVQATRAVAINLKSFSEHIVEVNTEAGVTYLPCDATDIYVASYRLRARKNRNSEEE
jgi:hypothetical protein